MSRRAAADLAMAAYRPPEYDARGEPTKVQAGDEIFIAVGHADTRSGYQGSIYKNVRTGDYVIAHRGTEFDRELLKDGVVDMVMVTGRFNPQFKDALELTRIAKGMAERDGKQLSVTGHSLGGGLGQVCAHHYSLPGELMPQREVDVGAGTLGRNNKRNSKRTTFGKPDCVRGRRDTRDHPHLALNRLPLLALIAMLAACGRKEPPSPPYEANPAPAEAYDVVISAQDAPVDIHEAAAYVVYRIADEGCLPPIDNFEGVRYGLEKHSLSIPLQRVDGHRFKGIFYRDGLARKDYFGSGICAWRVEHIGASLRMEGTASTAFLPIAITLQQGSETRYSAKDIKPLVENRGPAPANTYSPARFTEDVPTSKRGDFFSYSIEARARKRRQ